MSNQSWKNETIGSSQSISLGFYLVMAQDTASILVRTLIWLGMVRCRALSYPFEVTCIVCACWSYNTAVALWCIESCLKNIDSFRLPCHLHLVCNVITARQVFWILNNHCLVFLALHRVYVVHQSVVNNTQLMPMRRSIGYKMSAAIHLLDAALILLLHLSIYFTHSLVFNDDNEMAASKCSKSTRSSFGYYEKCVVWLKSYIPCAALFVCYVLVIPGYLRWNLSRAGKSGGREAARRVRRVVRLTVKFFVYTFLQILAWFMAAAIADLIVKRYAVKSGTRHLQAAFEITFGTLVAESVSGAWWLELLTWFYHFLDGYNPIVFLLMHKHLLNAVKKFFTCRKSF